MTAATWHNQAIDRLSELLARDPRVKAFVITGSLAHPEPIADEWSDIDARIVIEDEAVDAYYPSPTWLQPLGDVVAHEPIDNGAIKTLRVCLAPFRRLDLSFVPESCLTTPAATSLTPIPDQHRIVWCRLPHLPSVPPSSTVPSMEDAGAQQLERISEGFWYTATLAIVKAMRNDLLVSAHLAFAMARDCLVLQMLLREKGTTIHREGGYGNELVSELRWGGTGSDAVAILGLIGQYCTLFDRLASRLTDTYHPRHQQLADVIEQAMRYCQTRPTSA